MICQDCGVEAPTKYVSFHQNIGAFVVHFTRSVNGNLCKSCIHKHFWSTTGTTFFLGWWGVISFILTPFMLLNNVVRYAGCLGMPAVPPDAEAPRLTREAIDKIAAHSDELFERINQGEDLERVVGVMADKAGVTPGQIYLYVHGVVRAQQSQDDF